MNPRHLSQTAEHYTPAFIVEAARRVLGKIDLDPASNAFANGLVAATRFFDGTAVDGLRHEWRGRVFVNPPGGKTANRSNQKAWWYHLSGEYAAQRVSEAIFVSFSVELLQTSQVGWVPGTSLPLEHAICFPSRRVCYDREVEGSRVSGTSPPHASCIIYLGRNVGAFDEAFREIGYVKR